MNVDIFQEGNANSGEFFKFKDVGDAVQGTYIDVRNGIDSFGNQQAIYVIQDADGKIWNVAFRLTNIVVHERMNGIKFGQIVGFRYDELRPSKKPGMSDAKIIRIYADPKHVDHEWVAHQKSVDAGYTKLSPSVVSAVVDEDEGEYDNDVPFGAPEGAAPAGGNLPTGKPRNEAVDAIRQLAKTKGLTNDSMSEAEADAVIEKYTGLPLAEEHLTKVIIALTGYVSK